MSGNVVAAMPEENEPGLAIEISGSNRSFSKAGWKHFNACRKDKTAA
jgi:hypothetical protein